MPIISAVIMKIIDERETQTKKTPKKQTKTTKQRQKKARGTKVIVKGWELNDFVARLS